MAASASDPVHSVDTLIARISADYEGLSRQLKVIARYVEQHRDHIGRRTHGDGGARQGVPESVGGAHSDAPDFAGLEAGAAAGAGAAGVAGLAAPSDLAPAR